MAQNNRLRIVIAASHDLVRLGLLRILARRPEVEVVGEAASAAEAKELTARLQPDLVLMDTHLHDQTGVAASREVRSQNPQVRVLLLTTQGNDEAVVNAVVAGASGFLLKGSRAQEIIHSLRRLLRGQPLMNPTLTLRVMQRVRSSPPASEANQLSDLEQQILELVSRGHTDGEIAEAVSLTEEEVREYIGVIWSKLDSNRRVQAITYTANWRGRLAGR